MLDDKDKLLIAHLRRDARQSVISLARSIGLSRTATQERLRRLELTGVIRAYTVDIASDLDPAVRALIAVTLASGRRCEHIIPHISGMPEIIACHSLAGSIDLLLTIACESSAALGRIREAVAKVPGVATATTYVILSTNWAK